MIAFDWEKNNDWISHACMVNINHIPHKMCMQCVVWAYFNFMPESVTLAKMSVDQVSCLKTLESYQKINWQPTLPPPPSKKTGWVGGWVGIKPHELQSSPGFFCIFSGWAQPPPPPPRTLRQFRHACPSVELLQKTLSKCLQGKRQIRALWKKWRDSWTDDEEMISQAGKW